MRLCVFTRLAAAAGAVFLAAPAFGQTADVSATLALNGEAAVKTAGLTLGGSETYVITVHNAGPSHVTSFTVDAAFTPPAAPYNGAISIDSVTPAGASGGCVPTTVVTAPAIPPPFPCLVTLDAPLISGTSTTVEIAVTVPVPTPLPTAATDCPTAATTVHATASVPQVLQGTLDVDPNYADNTATPLDTKIRPFADLSVTSLTGPSNVSEGQAITYTEVVNNAGPCDAPNVFVDFFPPATLTFVSATGCDNNATFGSDAGCDFSTSGFPIGSKTFTADFTVNTFPKSIIKAAIPVDTDIASYASATVAAADDPHMSNNAASTSATVDLSKNDTGCSTGGAGTLLALLPLGALRFRRRRPS